MTSFWNSWSSPASTIEQFLEELPPLFKRKEEVLAVILFGSFARGEYSPQHSDIDLMVLLDRTEEDKVLEEAIRKEKLFSPEKQ